jgi:uncharacterized protein DUF2784
VSSPPRPSPWRAAVRIMADGVALVHLGVSFFIPFGGLLVWAGLAPLWLHLPIAAWGVYVHAADGTCPLTPLEKGLRTRAGVPTYSGGFVAQYLLPRRWRARAEPGGRSCATYNYTVAAGILLANVGIYALAFGRG